MSKIRPEAHENLSTGVALTASRFCRQAENMLNGYVRRFRVSGRGSEAAKLASDFTSVKKAAPSGTGQSRRISKAIPPLSPTDECGPEYSRLIGSLAQLATETDAVKACILHGSMASQDFTGYSDVDAVLILTDTAFQSAASVLNMRKAIREGLRAILSFDPLQHHGFHIIPECLLPGYPESYLPKSVYDTAVVVGSDRPLNLTLAGNQAEDVRPGLETIARGLLTRASAPTTAYEAKHFLSALMLLPTLRLQADRIETDKKHSFELCRERYPGLGWEPLDWATGIRETWQSPNLTRAESVMLRHVHPWIVSRAFLSRKALPHDLQQQWTQERHQQLLGFVREIRCATPVQESIA